MGRTRRLPDGRTTEDDDEYAEAWISVGRAVARHFPGYEPYGFDPSVQLVSHSPRPYSDHITLSMAAVRSLLSTCKACAGDPKRTAGGTECDGCGLVGTMPWGG